MSGESKSPKGLLALSALLAALALWGCSDGGAEERVVKVPGVRLIEAGGTWSPDSRRLASAAPDGLVIKSPDGKRERSIVAPPIRIDFGWGTPIEWSTDGRRLFYATAQGPKGRGGYWATEVSVRDEAVSQTSLGTELAFPTFSPGGWPLVYATGPFEPELDGSRSGPPAGLRIIDGPGAEPRPLLATTGLPEDPVVSPDGSRVIFKQWRRGGTELWSVGIDGSNPERLARFTYLRHYEWSPDGKWIGISGVGKTPVAGHRLYLLPSEGGRAKRIGGAELFSGPTWAPDGRWLTYATTDGAIQRIRPRGGKAETLAVFDGEGVGPLRWSPNGRYLAYRAYPLPSEYD